MAPAGDEAANDSKAVHDMDVELDPARRGKLTLERRRELAQHLLAYNTRDRTFFQAVQAKVRTAAVGGEGRGGVPPPPGGVCVCACGVGWGRESHCMRA